MPDLLTAEAALRKAAGAGEHTHADPLEIVGGCPACGTLRAYQIAHQVLSREVLAERARIRRALLDWMAARRDAFGRPGQIGEIMIGDSLIKEALDRICPAGPEERKNA